MSTMSLGNVQYQLQQQQQQQHPLLAAISGNNYAHGHRRSGAHFYHPMQSYRPHGAYAHSSSGAGTSGSGYGYEPTGGSGYEYPPAAPVHTPSGGSYSHHAAAGVEGYGVPAPTSARPALFGSKGKKQSSQSSTMTALTLLSFFFFVNLLQNCLKDNMDAMNPTVMVMTAGVVRNRYNKLAEMNSREQNTSPSAATFSSGANIVVQPADLVSAAASSLAAVSAVPTVMLQSPYSNGGGGVVDTGSSSSSTSSNHNTRKPAAAQSNYHNNNNNNNNNDYAGNSNNNSNYNNYNNDYNNNNSNEQIPFANDQHDPRPEFYDSTHSYPNHTLAAVTSTDKRHNYQQQRPHQHQHQQQQQHAYGVAHDERHQGTHHYSPHMQHAHSDAAYPWSYGGAASSSFSTHKRGPTSPHSSSSVWSSASLPAHVSGNNYFNDDRYADSYYTRIN